MHNIRIKFRKFYKICKDYFQDEINGSGNFQKYPKAPEITGLHYNGGTVKASDFSERGFVTIAPANNLPDDFVLSIKNGSWSDPATWNNGKVPGMNDRVFIKHKVQVDGPAKCFTLFIDPGADLQMVAGNQLEIVGIPQQ